MLGNRLNLYQKHRREDKEREHAMTEIISYIKGLLFIHNCVIIPGFGGFVTNVHASEHDSHSHTFHPPKKDILFNNHLTYNDGLLISYLSKNLKMHYNEAEELVKRAVENMWTILDEKETLVVPGLGSFSLDVNQRPVFEPKVEENYLTDSYGLSSFRFPPLNYQASDNSIRKLNSNSAPMSNGMKQTLKWAAIAIPLLGILTLIPYKKSKYWEQKSGIDFSTESSKAIEEMHTARTADTSVAIVIDNAADKRVALFYSENQAEEKMKPQETTAAYYYIIGASYKDEANAIKQMEIFEKEGYSPSILNEDGLYRVVLSSYDDKLNALHELRRIRNEENNDKVWLLAK